MPHPRLFLILLGALIAGCSTPSEYGPRPPGGLVGYSNLQLSPTRYRVSFEGSTGSTQDDVETYLLRRAAEVTLQAGYTHFVMSGRHIERSTESFGGYPYDGGYHYGYSPYWTVDSWSATRFSASAEITTMNSGEAVGNSEAVEAITLLQRLSPPTFPLASVSPQPQSYD